MSESNVPGGREPDITTQVLEDLTDGSVADRVADLVFAACQGDRELAEVVGGARPVRPEQASVGATSSGVFLKSIAVEGFRGIGQKQTLHLTPTPGVTLVVGRNGSGKSSFAEAAEIAVTGRSSRWAERAAVWRSGWRNLHHGATAVQVEAIGEGAGAPLTLRCDWASDGELDSATLTVKRAGETLPVGALGWDAALSTYRPFLSYAELGDAVSGRPTQLYDALWSILGLETVEEGRQRLRLRVKDIDDRLKAVRQRQRAVAGRLAALEDERASRAAAQLVSKQPDLAALEALATGAPTAADPRMSAWRAIAGAPFPSEDVVLRAAEELEEAAAAAARAEAELGSTSLRLAEILDRAAAHIEAEGPGPCPVCGVTTLGLDWPGAAHARAHELRQSAQSVHAARTRLKEARQRLATVIASAASPGVFSESHLEIADGLIRWHAIRAEADPRASEAAIELVGEVGRQIDTARTAAATQIQAHEDRWQPVAVELAAWVADARATASDASALADLKKAEKWLREEAQGLRDARMQPFADHSTRVWEQLRQESSVSLGAVKLAGSGPARKLDIRVSVDGADGAALGVMSQGELHALGLALFIPRAASDSSPFRFLVIDDPVQAMDPAKVDGLARVLEEVGRTRQVVVFTHDERLPEAVRRLGIDATIWEVVRRPNSEIELRKAHDAVTRYLEDARAVAATKELASVVKGPVIAGLLRSAIEAAALDRARRRMVDAGVSRSEIQTRVQAAQSTNELLALGLFDDAKAGDRVLGRLNNWGSRLADAYQHCRSGVHVTHFEGWDTQEFMGLARDVKTLVDKIAQAS